MEKASEATRLRILLDGGVRTVQQTGHSLTVSLPSESAATLEVEQGDEVAVVPSDRDGVLWEIRDPEEALE
jgi:phosphate uptake regulator